MARLSREDWVDAAYRHFADNGLDAVRVEPVAREIGATKGSFYWHFADRAELVDAVLDRWEDSETSAVIGIVDESDDPRERLERLVRIVTTRTPDRGGEATLFTAAERNGVVDAVARVTERRVAFVASVLAQLGFDAAESRRRATTLVAAVVGYQQLIATGWSPGQDTPEMLAASLLEMAIGPHRE
ncbi:TetR/AcrR family transcriptional regulator [Microbacterium aoyamense]|uniref:TetR/AcrR family transcriptional regulator n=1 Tax=Microbacterium aoyamense TaxID=344166 RepID=A0ABN2PZ93_9MICO|nr:TetR/AcrR family transcriptional regulator [Microbacterium aoyamense]